MGEKHPSEDIFTRKDVATLLDSVPEEQRSVVENFISGISQYIEADNIAPWLQGKLTRLDNKRPIDLLLSGDETDKQAVFQTIQFFEQGTS